MFWVSHFSTTLIVQESLICSDSKLWSNNHIRWHYLKQTCFLGIFEQLFPSNTLLLHQIIFSEKQVCRSLYLPNYVRFIQSAKNNFAAIKNVSLTKTEQNTILVLSSVPQNYSRMYKISKGWNFFSYVLYYLHSPTFINVIV